MNAELGLWPKHEMRLSQHSERILDKHVFRSTDTWHTIGHVEPCRKGLIRSHLLRDRKVIILETIYTTSPYLLSSVRSASVALLIESALASLLI